MLELQILLEQRPKNIVSIFPKKQQLIMLVGWVVCRTSKSKINLNRKWNV